MAIKKVKLPNNTVVDINDPRIPGVDSTPTSGSTNVVTSGGVKTALDEATVTESTVSGWGFTKNTGTLTGVKFNGTSASVSGGVASITATIPSAPGTLITNATSAQTASSGEAMSGSITLHKVAKTGTYSDLIGKPTIPSAPGTLNTTATTAQSTSSSEALSGSITLHKVAKTGTYSDLVGKPTIPSAPGTLNTTATSAQSTSSSEALSGSVTLHKVSKTGSYNDLNNKPTIPSAPGTLNTNNTTAQTVSSSEALSGAIKLHKVSKTGTYSDLVGKPTVDSSPTASSSNLVSSGGVYTALQSKPNYAHLSSESGMPASPDANTLYLIDDNGEVFVSTSQQSLSAAQKTQARTNIGAAATSDIPTTVASMTDASNYPKYVLLANEAAYNALTTKDSGTLYLIPKTS